MMLQKVKPALAMRDYVKIIILTDFVSVFYERIEWITEGTVTIHTGNTIYIDERLTNSCC